VTTVSEIQVLRPFLKAARAAGRIGFVPTMGAFHEGHLSLMREARKECDFVVVSLFVNPLQFGENEDFKHYPRDISADQKMAEAVGVDLLWIPLASELYPPDFQSTIEVPEISRLWEGQSRPGHFKGVATIVAKLLQIVRPERLFLGQKDYQQTRVIRQMMADLHFEAALRVLPTVREADGLAMSSRNRRLSSSDRKAAAILYRALCSAESLVQKGERRGVELLLEAEALIKREPDLKIDYLALCDRESLQPLERLEVDAVLLAALCIGPIRLIDNILLSA